MTGGDFNMTEEIKDSTSRSPLLISNQLEEWRVLKTRFSLKDALHVTKLNGPKFTRRGKIDNNIIQSRLDQFYISDHGTWVSNVSQLKHHTQTVLPDHNPISLEFTVNKQSLNNKHIQRSSYFKADPI
jgi:hypothetical protein